MLASLSGVVAATGKGFVVIQVGGVGFQVAVPQTVLDGLASSGPELTVHTHLHVRENELALYGFGSEEELALFRLLLGVSGIGPKVGLSVLSFLPVDRLQAAIAQEDVAMLARVPGIGPKTAKKLVFDLKDKIAVDMMPGDSLPVITEADADLIAALTTLGYSVSEAQEAIRSLPREDLPLEERVRLALVHFSS
ncbi:MAG: Holliday junction branch migration protein RuvA [Anaerolineae bacterium]|nr:Holliday junction branch migration protein RuvA [Anaerolineae bacterium]